MCYCTPNIRTPHCGSIQCVPDIHEGCFNRIKQLESQIENLMKIISDANFLKQPLPIIACKDCPKINWDLLKGKDSGK